MLNKAQLIGHLGRDPEVRQTKNGQGAVANLTLAQHQLYVAGADKGYLVSYQDDQRKRLWLVRIDRRLHRLVSMPGSEMKANILIFKPFRLFRARVIG
ncbi:Helix-destabilizing protein [Thiorhodovibrio winogradskyi]|uniref:Helix-destabilizing protein n=2 Tax=Thiorhodovibrio winogradskyi TaxID=77007 RepID=A0ABZ0S9Z5_9GAMM